MVELFAPQESCRRLPGDLCGFFIKRAGELCEKTVSFALSQVENFRFCFGVSIPIRDRYKPEVEAPGFCRRELHAINRGHFGAARTSIAGQSFPQNDVIVEGVLDMKGRIFGAVQTLEIRFVFCKQNFLRFLIKKIHGLQRLMFSTDLAGPVAPNTRLPRAPLVRASPRPSVSEPKVGKNYDGGGYARPVRNGDLYMNIIGRSLCELRKDIEISVRGKRACINQLIFRLSQAAPTIFMSELIVWECSLGVFVKCFEVRMSWRGIEVVITLFDIFAVIAFGSGESEESLLQHCVLSIP